MNKNFEMLTVRVNCERTFSLRVARSDCIIGPGPKSERAPFNRQHFTQSINHFISGGDPLWEARD